MTTVAIRALRVAVVIATVALVGGCRSVGPQALGRDQIDYGVSIGDSDYPGHHLYLYHSATIGPGTKCRGNKGLVEVLAMKQECKKSVFAGDGVANI